MTYIAINVDRVAKKSSYEGLKSNELLVYSKFVTIQGEGPFAGKRSLFVRLAGCNFGDKGAYCQFCDTKFFLDNGKPETFESILNRVTDAAVDLLVVTGGEPLLQPNIVKATEFWLKENKRLTVQFETNGTQVKNIVDLLTMAILYDDRVTVICSPKASSKAGYVKAAPVSRQTMDAFPKNFFYKFVVTSDSRDPHYLIPFWATEVANKVFISPMTIYVRNVKENEIASAWDTTLVNQEATRANYKRAAHLAMQNDFTVSIQMHTWLDME